MNEYPPIIVIIAALLTVLTTVISLRVFKGNPVLGNPVISICVGGITFIGLCSCASKELHAIIIPYVTLALCFPMVLFMLLFSGFWEKHAVILLINNQPPFPILEKMKYPNKIDGLRP